MSRGEVRIPASLVRYLRSGVKQELSETVECLARQLESELDRERYHHSLARFDQARALFEQAGVVEEPQAQADLVLDLERWPRLVLEALQSQYEAELVRLESAAADGIELPQRNIPALGGLVADIREQVGAQPTRRHARSFLARHPKRSRGDD